MSHRSRVRARSEVSRALVWAVGVLAFSCNGETWAPVGPGVPAEEGGICVDEDRDGYGLGCLAGLDCDDGDATRHRDCGGPDGDADSDTDGDADGVAAGEPGFGPRPAEGSSSGTGDGRTSWRPDGDNSSNVVVTEEGSLMLDADLDMAPAVWIANDDEGTVSRLDMETGREIGRYPALISGADPDSDPSRTAIDFRGDCWVANRFRETNRVGTVTKIAAHLQDCVDRNGDGAVQTSSDLNGNGVIDLGTPEFPDEGDECVLFTVEVGERRSIPRALAIAPDPRGNSSAGNAWVGLNYGEENHGRRSCAEIDGATGEVLQYIDLPLNPYGALASKYEGQVWFVNATWQSNLPDNPPAIVSVNYRTGEVSPRYEIQADEGCVGTYGMTIDADSRVWVAGYDCRRAFRFDPRSTSWMTVELGDDAGYSRGLVADAEGWIWVAHSSNCNGGSNGCGEITRFFGEDGSALQRYELPDGRGTIGVDVDINGRIWVVNKQTNSASRIDPISGQIEEFPTGEGPYTYSDFTGHSLLLQFPRGFYRDVVEACTGAIWERAMLDLSLPTGSAVELRVRAADQLEDLASADWVGPWLTFPGDLQMPPGPAPNGRYLEFELTLTTEDHSNSPVIRALDLLYSCPVM